MHTTDYARRLNSEKEKKQKNTTNQTNKKKRINAKKTLQGGTLTHSLLHTHTQTHICTQIQMYIHVHTKSKAQVLPTCT